MKGARALMWLALGLIAGAWTCRLAWIAVPAISGPSNFAAEALYLAELDQQRAAAIVMAPSVESIAAEVHWRAARLFVWIGAGLGLCLVATLTKRAQWLAITMSGTVFLAGWIQLDSYAYVGVLHGLDLKLRLVGSDEARLLQIVILDGVLPLVVACATVATLALAPRLRAKSD